MPTLSAPPAVVVLVLAWLVMAVVPLGWWTWTRRRVDPWQCLPVPAALIDARGRVRSLAGPSMPDGLELTTAVASVPAPGRSVRLRTPAGIPLAATGVRGGALVVVLPADPLRQHRDTLLVDLGARLAHDINTPLAALTGHLDLIAHEALTAAARTSVATCQRELERLRTTTSDLLTLTRLRANPGPRRVCLAGALVEDAASAYLDVADAAGVDLLVEVPATRVVVEVGEADLVRVLRNLIANALRHGVPVDPAGSRLPNLRARPHLQVDQPLRADLAPAAPRRRGRMDTAQLDTAQLDTAQLDLTSGTSRPRITPSTDIVVAVDADADSVTFSVADRGPGLDPADLPRLCDPLTRGVSREGSGLGLAIVAEVLAGHGSRLECDARPGGGAVLSFTVARAA